MAPLDLADALAAIDPATPAGPNLELDATFGELERATEGAPEKQYGETIIAAVEPDWRDVAERAAALLRRTHDLRVLVHLAIARLQLGGLPPFAATLADIRVLLETQWQDVHPQLDPEDGNDPAMRANILLRLADPKRVLRVLRDMPLAASRLDGAISWRLIPSGAAESEAGQPRKSEAAIRAAFADSAAGVAKLRDAVETALRESERLTTAFEAQAGAGSGPDLSPLRKLLQEIARHIRTYMVPETQAEDEAAPAQTEPDVTAAAELAAAATSAARPTPPSIAGLTSVATRAEALRLLEVACRYFEQNEPSSPLPLIIARARRLADKGFLEILQDLAPDGLGQAQSVVQSRDV